MPAAARPCTPGLGVPQDATAPRKLDGHSPPWRAGNREGLNAFRIKFVTRVLHPGA